MDLSHANLLCMSASISFGELPGGKGREGIPTSALCKVRALPLVQQGGALCPAAESGVPAAGREAERQAAV